MAAELLGRVPNPTWAAWLYRYTQGNPLFVLETVRAGTEDVIGGEDEPQTRSLPPRIQAVVQARLSRLSQVAYELAELAATIGRSFALTLLIMASNRERAEVVAGLDELWQRRFVRELEANLYDFTHDMLREAIYADVSPIRRRAFHHHIGEGLEQIHQQEPETVAAQLAFHYEQAHQTEQAASWYRRAAAAQRNLYASADAAASLQKGIALLGQLPQSRARMQLELEMLLDLGHDLRIFSGHSEPRLESVLRRAHTLAQQVGDNQLHLITNVRLAAFLRARGDKEQSRVLTEQLLDIAQETEDPKLQAEAYFQNARLHTHLGNFARAHSWLLQATELYTPDVAQEWAELWPDKTQTGPPRAIYEASLGLVQWILGYPDRAVTQLESAIAGSKKIPQPMYTASVLLFSLHIYKALRDIGRVQVLAEELAQLGDRYQNPNAAHNALLFLGWLKVEEGNFDEGIKLTRQGVHFYRRTSRTLYYTYYLALLAELYLQASDPDAAARTIDEALAVSAASDEHMWDSELFRLRGHVLLEQGAPTDVVERCYQKALSIAQGQQARSLELRATMSLARLWQGQDRAQFAYQQLSTVYGWFTEGLDTPDLIEARELLDRLADRSLM